MSFENLIDSAEKVRSETVGRKDKINKAVTEQMNAIHRAKKAGRSETCWILDNTDIEDAVKKMFIKKGYTFRPTGYIGGVWQTTINICWWKE